jgi:hypothetical protein
MKRKTYQVVGPRNVAGHAPGETFQATYGEDHERYLIDAGHLAIVQPQTEKKEAK